MDQWDIHFKRIKESELINVADKEFIVEGQKKLFQVFDNKWLSDDTAQKFTHPFTWQFDNIVPISQSKLAELGLTN